MRFIDIDAIETPEGWEQKAEKVRASIAKAVEEADNDELGKSMAKAGRLWTKLRLALSLLSDGKCWYCESLEVRSDLNVDHFRPKQRVHEAPLHAGYWWLSLEPGNYRLSCQFCNQHRRGVDGGSGGGKADHFPIENEGRRAATPSDDLLLEKPMLLDPTSAFDTSMLTFGYDGKAAAHPLRCTSGSPAEARVKDSLRLYHLNHPGIRDARKVLNRSLKRDFDDAVRLLQSDASTIAVEQAARNSVENLIRAVSPKSEYSSAARAYVLSRRGASVMEEFVAEVVLHS